MPKLTALKVKLKICYKDLIHFTSSSRPLPFLLKPRIHRLFLLRIQIIVVRSA